MFYPAVCVLVLLQQWAVEADRFVQPRFANQSDLVKFLKSTEDHFKSDKVAEAMTNIDRKYYVQDPYVDLSCFVPGFGTVESPPSMIAFALEILQEHLSRHKSRVLDVGYGTGYLTACMAAMMGPEGYAVGLDTIKKQVAYANSCIEKDEYVKENKLQIKFVAGKLENGYRKDGPYDAIYVTPAHSKEVPPQLLRQLKKGGRLVIPIGRAGFDHKKIMLYDKHMNGTVILTEHKFWFFQRRQFEKFRRGVRL